MLFGATAIIWCLATPALAQQASARDGQAAEAPDAAVIEEVIVTAQRRRERIQDVPISITAFSADRLEQQGIKQPQDLQGSVPSLVVNSVGQHHRDVQSITLRGQGASYQASPGVVVYLNEVPLPAPAGRSLQGGPGNFLDLENVQVLAGLVVGPEEAVGGLWRLDPGPSWQLQPQGRRGRRQYSAHRRQARDPRGRRFPRTRGLHQGHRVEQGSR
jgi:hypothetical protein